MEPIKLKLTHVLITCWLALCFSGSVYAETTLYGIDDVTDSFYEIDISTGVKSLIGRLDPLGNTSTNHAPNLFLTPEAMATRQSDGTIFAWNNSRCRGDLNPGEYCGSYGNYEYAWELVTINSETGAATPVSSGPQVQMHALAFDPVTETLYGIRTDYIKGIYTIDTETGVAVDTGIDFNEDAAGADFDACGNLFIVTRAGGELWKVEKGATTATFIGVLNEGGVALSALYGWDDMYARTIAFAPDGTLLGSLNNPDFALFEINPQTAEVSNNRGTQIIHGMGFLTDDPAVCSDGPTPIGVDIKPQSCPNPLNLKSRGNLPVAVLGTEEFDVMTIDPETVGLSREGIEDIVKARRYAYEDVATPFEGELCDCHTLGPDGFLDLTLKFSRRELVEKLKLYEVAGQTVPLILTGNLVDEVGTPIKGQDCVRVKKKRKPRK